MTATVIPFRPATVTTGPHVVTAKERAFAAAWCAQRGPEWSAEAIIRSDGTVALGLVTPRRAGNVAWIVARVPTGFALVDTIACKAVGVFGSMRMVLEVVAATNA